jgi:RNA polymerase sigma factor (sigma-70 family)
MVRREVAVVGTELDDLPARMEAGEEAAFRDFADAVGPRLRRLYLYKGLSEADAESLAVSAVSDIALRIDQYAPQGPGSFCRWVYRVAENALHEQLRRRRPALLGDAAQTLPAASDAEDLEGPADLSRVIGAALAELGEPDRTILTLRVEHPERTFAEIGSQVRMTENAVRVRHHRALRKLGELLKDQPPVRLWRQRLRLAPEEGD